MKNSRIHLLSFTIFSFLLSSCYYEVEEELFPPAECTTGVVTYSTTINPILNNYGCVGCHSGSAPSGNFSLVGYNNVKAKVNDNRLWGAINHHTGFSPMPKDAAKMNQCDINKIKLWIDAGAPNN